MDLYTLQQLCIYWQKKLRLQDWDIHLSIERRHNMDIENTTACSTYNICAKKAWIQILDPIDYHTNGFYQDIEQSLIHELIHLHFSPLSIDYSNEKCPWYMEAGIDAIATSLVEINRVKKKQKKLLKQFRKTYSIVEVV